MFSCQKSSDLMVSRLYNEQSFYKTFERDITKAMHAVIIESPFITTKRLAALLPIIQKLRRRSISITINTRNPLEHDELLKLQAQGGIAQLQELGVIVLFTGSHHRKIAIIDNHILWEGSLNILSQGDSCEIMRRTDSPVLVQQMIQFTGLGKWYNLGDYEYLSDY